MNYQQSCMFRKNVAVGNCAPDSRTDPSSIDMIILFRINFVEGAGCHAEIAA